MKQRLLAVSSFFKKIYVRLSTPVHSNHCVDAYTVVCQMKLGGFLKGTIFFILLIILLRSDINEKKYAL